jgi:hypothetical protein
MGLSMNVAYSANKFALTGANEFANTKLSSFYR